MKNKEHILVVGGAGYIGSHTNKLLSQKDYKTVVFDNLIYGHKEFVKWGEFFLGDLANKEQIRQCFRRYPISAVMHFSAFAYVGESVADPAKYYRNNVANTLNLLDVMHEFEVKYFIFSSTCATYGIPERIPITEDHPQKPVNPYGKSKLMVEDILKDYDSAYGIKHINLRYFNAAGADPDGEIGEDHDPETHLIPLVLDAAAGKRPHITIFGDDYDTPDGTCIRDYIHVTDLAQAHVLALRALENKAGSIAYNLGNGQGYSVREVIKMAEKVTGRSIPVKISDRRIGDPPTLIGNAAKIIDELGWIPEFSDMEAIVKTAWEWNQHKKSD
jgi:UDP-glucose 4-epimerase